MNRVQFNLVNFNEPEPEYTAGGGGVVKTINGLAIASVKTINGLAIGSVKTKNGAATQ